MWILLREWFERSSWTFRLTSAMKTGQRGKILYNDIQEFKPTIAAVLYPTDLPQSRLSK